MDSFFDRNNKRWFYLAVLTVLVFLMQISMVAASAVAMQPVVSGLSTHKGPASGGTPVTVFGNGFRTGDIVMFGTVPAEKAVVVSPYIINAVSPAAGSGIIDVRVAARGVMRAVSAVTLADRFTYIANYKIIRRKPVRKPVWITHAPLNLTLEFPPTITGVNPNYGPPQGGTLLTITGSGFLDGATEVVFNLATDVPIANGVRSPNCPQTITIAPWNITFINDNNIQLNTFPDIEAVLPGTPAQPVPTACPYVLSIITPRGTYSGTDTIPSQEFSYLNLNPNTAPAAPAAPASGGSAAMDTPTDVMFQMDCLAKPVHNVNSTYNCLSLQSPPLIWIIGERVTDLPSPYGHGPHDTGADDQGKTCVFAVPSSSGIPSATWLHIYGTCASKGSPITFSSSPNSYGNLGASWKATNLKEGLWRFSFDFWDKNTGINYTWTICNVPIVSPPSTFSGLSNKIVLDLLTGDYWSSDYTPNISPPTAPFISTIPYGKNGLLPPEHAVPANNTEYCNPPLQ